MKAPYSALGHIDSRGPLTKKLCIGVEVGDSAQKIGDRVLCAMLDPANHTVIEPPVKLLLWCPGCGKRHIDKGAFAGNADGFTVKHHHTHACQKCGFVWRPAVEATVGVKFLPGFKNKKEPR